MEPIDEFKGIGKKLPYKAPDNFFETAALKTIQEAKCRERKTHKNNYLWRSVAIAASIATIGLVGYFMLNTETKTETQVVIQESKPANQPNPVTVAVQPKAETLPFKKSVKPEKVAQPAVINEEPRENLDELLADLTDEELLQMAAMIKSDPFGGEQEQ
jgi:hypothetical protein